MGKAKRMARRKYVFSDGTVIYDDQAAVSRKVRECNWEIGYRVERIDGRAA